MADHQSTRVMQKQSRKKPHLYYCTAEFESATTAPKPAVTIFLQHTSPLYPQPDTVSRQRVAPALLLETYLRQRVPKGIPPINPYSNQHLSLQTVIFLINQRSSYDRGWQRTYYLQNQQHRPLTKVARTYYLQHRSSTEGARGDITNTTNSNKSSITFLESLSTVPE